VNPDGIAQLTTQEFRVALAAVQLSCGQKQLATRLGMSYDTVRQTLKRVYRRLGIQSRLELRDVWAVRR
jgi:DNA-binding CsgD family transcriptional regulator